MEFEDTFMDFLLEHQEQQQPDLPLPDPDELPPQRRQAHPVLLPDGRAPGEPRPRPAPMNCQGEDVMMMDQIADSLVMHYLEALRPGHPGRQRGVRRASSR